MFFLFCRNELKWDDDDIYVIGGLVDVDIRSNASLGTILELVSKELNQMAVILHVYARGLNFIKNEINFVIIFQKENGNTFTLLIIFIVKSLQKEQNSTNLLL